MGDLKNIFSKLNIMEQSQINNYINLKISAANQEANKMIDDAREALEKDNKAIKKYYEDENAKTWKKIQTMLDLSMREHHVSYERMNKIYSRLQELDKRKDLLIGEEQESEYKILQDSDFQKMIELLMDSSCKNCKDHSKNCEVHQLLKKYNIPHSGCKSKCKYAYYKIGKKVV